VVYNAYFSRTATNNTSGNTLEQLARVEHVSGQRSLSEVAEVSRMRMSRALCSPSTQKTDWNLSMEIRVVDEPKTWRLLSKPDCEDTTGTLDEVVFTIRGILCGKDLPPVTEKPK
jgi:hypothetical protein